MSASKTNVKWEKIGNLIEPFDNRNIKSLNYPFYGINKDKTFMPTVADTNNLDRSKYKVVNEGDFVFSGMQTGRDICIRIALYDKTEPIIISPAYTTFKIINKNELLPEYFFIQFNRFEMDRYGWFLSDGSIRSNLDWDRFCDIKIPLPPIEVQQELVDTYNGLKSLAEQNEALIEPLSKACEALTIKCLTQSNIKKEKVGNLITFYEKVNVSGLELPIYGINKNKTFMPTVADTNNLNKAKYKLVGKNIFAFSGMQTGRDVCIRIAYMEDDREFLISPAYTTFKLNDLSKILPQFFFIFCRFEMDRLGWFLSDGSIRSNLDLERFCDIEIPLPPIEVQQSIVNLYHCMEEAKKIASEAREKLKEICPALIQKALHQ